MCVCVCVYVYVYTNTHTHTYIYIYMYICIHTHDLLAHEHTGAHRQPRTATQTDVKNCVRDSGHEHVKSKQRVQPIKPARQALHCKPCHALWGEECFNSAWGILKLMQQTFLEQ